MNTLAVIGGLIWLYILSVLKRGKIYAWYFGVGSIGVFLWMMIGLQNLILMPLTKAVTAVAGILGQLTGIYTSYFQYGMLLIERGSQTISLYIDFECSGVIEILAFSSLLWFFPAYQLYEKVIVNLIGIMVIFASNVFRIFCIAGTIFIGGNEAYYLAHTILGRFIFYACSIILYYVVFTRTQIVRQKVGSFKYDNQ